MDKKLTKKQKNIISVIVALIMAASCSYAAIQSMYYAIYMIAMDVRNKYILATKLGAYDIPSFGSMPKFFIGASVICFATAIFLIKNIIELIHTTKRSVIEGDKN